VSGEIDSLRKAVSEFHPIGLVETIG